MNIRKSARTTAIPKTIAGYRETIPRLRYALYAGFILISLGHISAVPAAEPGASTDDAEFRNGYSAGYAFGNHLARLQDQGVALEAVFSGILDALSGTPPRLGAESMQAALEVLMDDSASPGNKQQQPPVRVRGRGYKDDFAALNARREGVVSLPSGVQYEVMKAGTGRKPGATDAVQVNYQGALSTGTVFDTTYEEGKPARLQMADIAVPGLKEALLLMNEGAKWRVVIPPQMGFGRSGNNQLRRRDLIYEIELVSVETGETAPGE